MCGSIVARKRSASRSAACGAGAAARVRVPALKASRGRKKRLPSRMGPAFPPEGSGRLDHDLAHHVRMKRAEILVGAGAVESEREFVAGIERGGAEGLAGGDDGVRIVVGIGPGDGGAR